MEFRQILAATDFSAGAEQACNRAAHLAQQHGATLHLLHVLPPMTWKAFGSTLVEHPLIIEKHLFKAAEERLENLADAYRQDHAITVQATVDIGRVYQHIADYADKHAIDLAVLGPHAKHMARDLFIGSTASRFLRRGTHPTLIARSPVDKPYRQVLIAIDFSDTSPLAVEAAASIAPNAILHLLHVDDVMYDGRMSYAGVNPDIIQEYRDTAGEDAQRMMTAFVAERPERDRLQPIVREGYPPRVIMDQASSLQADLVVLGKRGRSELDRLFLGSVSETLIHTLDRDLLLVAQ